MLHKIFKIPIYFGELHVFVSEDFNKINKDFKLNITQHIINHEAICGEFNKSNGYTRYFLLIHKDVTDKIIVHESKHIVNFIFNDRQISLDLINDDPECYLLGWIFSKIKEVTKNI